MNFEQVELAKSIFISNGIKGFVFETGNTRYDFCKYGIAITECPYITKDSDDANMIFIKDLLKQDMFLSIFLVLEEKNYSDLMVKEIFDKVKSHEPEPILLYSLTLLAIISLETNW